MGEKRRLKANVEFEVNTEGYGLGMYLPLHLLNAISDPVPPPSVRQRLIAIMENRRGYTNAGLVDEILADLGLDENGKRALPDDATMKKLCLAYCGCSEMSHIPDYDDPWRVKALRAVLLATGHYAEPVR